MCNKDPPPHHHQQDGSMLGTDQGTNALWVKVNTQKMEQRQIWGTAYHTALSPLIEESNICNLVCISMR